MKTIVFFKSIAVMALIILLNSTFVYAVTQKTAVTSISTDDSFFYNTNILSMCLQMSKEDLEGFVANEQSLHKLLNDMWDEITVHSENAEKIDANINDNMLCVRYFIEEPKKSISPKSTMARL